MITASVRGLDPEGPAEIVQVQWIGRDALKVVFRTSGGELMDRMLYRSDESSLSLITRDRPWSFNGDPATFRLVAEAERIRLAALFDPMLAVHTSVVEPLPHQILAVYDQMLKRHPLRFLLADDPGAGKTIMAGLLIKEMRARGDLERCLIISPGGLVEQWQDELSSKFQLPFQIATNDGLEAAMSGNWFSENPLAIARLDKLSRNDDVQEMLRTVQWDLVVIDEAHKLSASYFGGEAKFTKRFRLGELVSGTARHFLLMTATPHNGKEEDFQLFLRLLDGDRFEGRPRDTTHVADCSDLMRRMVKEQLRRFDGTPLFPERRAYTVAYDLSPAEIELYRKVTEYVRNEFNRVENLGEGGRKGTVGFALTILQRRLASSPEAIYQSLSRRRQRLESRLREAEALLRGGADPRTLLGPELTRLRDEEDLIEVQDSEDWTAEEVEAAENEVLDQATAAATIDELRIEIGMLRELESQADLVRRGGVDRKWEELSRLLQDQPEMFTSSGARRKVIIFTEHRDTLSYLHERISTLFGRPEAIVVIHGQIGRDQRRKAEEAFRFDPEVQVLLATDAAGEGLNLQRAHLMVNYDLPWNPNRLEQRFGRIHRIGQKEVCHCWNLLAHETREGEVYKRLLDKLEAQRAALGGRDAVFDVLGKLFEQTSLREMLIQAVRYGKRDEVKAQLFQKIDMTADLDRVRDAIDKDVLARDTMDTRRIEKLREEMARAEVNRLQPYHVENWFNEAFPRVGGRFAPREKGRFEITRVPGSVVARDRQIGRAAPVQPRYERATFDKSLVNVEGSPTAAFLCPGHPLLDSLIDLTLESHRGLLKQGTTLLDPKDKGQEISLLLMLQHDIRDGIQIAAGDRRIISRQLQFVRVRNQPDAGLVFSPAGAAPYIDMEPLSDDDRARLGQSLTPPWMAESDTETLAVEYAAAHLVPEHVDRVRTDRLALLDKTRAAVHERLTREIQHWDHRAQELALQEQAGRQTKLSADNAQRRADDLQARLEKRMALIERQRMIAPGVPQLLGAAVVVPQGLLNTLSTPEEPSDKIEMLSQTRRSEIDRLAIQAVLDAERQAGREPREMPHHNEGYDIESRDPNQPGRLWFIEVKGKQVGQTTVTISACQIRAACNDPDQWRLALVQIDGDTTQKPAYVPGSYFRQPIDFPHASVNIRLSDILQAVQQDA